MCTYNWDWVGRNLEMGISTLKRKATFQVDHLLKVTKERERKVKLFWKVRYGTFIPLFDLSNLLVNKAKLEFALKTYYHSSKKIEKRGGKVHCLFLHGLFCLCATEAGMQLLLLYFMACSVGNSTRHIFHLMIICQSKDQVNFHIFLIFIFETCLHFWSNFS